MTVVGEKMAAMNITKTEMVALVGIVLLDPSKYVVGGTRCEKITENVYWKWISNCREKPLWKVEFLIFLNCILDMNAQEIAGLNNSKTDLQPPPLWTCNDRL